jgi:hypothetical protein
VTSGRQQEIIIGDPDNNKKQGNEMLKSLLVLSIMKKSHGAMLVKNLIGKMNAQDLQEMKLPIMGLISWIMF